MKPRIKVLTLGVEDLHRSLAFYRDGMGLETQGIIGQEFENGAVVFFHMNDELILALYPTASLSEDAKIDLKHLWDYTYRAAATRFFTDWYQRAIRSRIEPLKTFARNLKARLAGIIAHCRYPLHTSLLEGITNKIKVLKRMGYGYRDDGYFFLKIMAAFPGIPENAG